MLTVRSPSTGCGALAVVSVAKSSLPSGFVGFVDFVAGGAFSESDCPGGFEGFVGFVADGPSPEVVWPDGCQFIQRDGLAMVHLRIDSVFFAGPAALQSSLVVKRWWEQFLLVPWPDR